MAKDHGSSNADPHWKAEPSHIKGPDCIPARALNIVWGSHTRYWEWIKMEEGVMGKSQTPDSKEAAMLIQINWLAVTGKIDMKRLEAGKTYTVYYIVKFQVDAFGWHSVPVQFMVRVTGKEYAQKSAKLEQYQAKPDEWHEVPGGEFTAPSDGEGAGSVEFGMFEVDSDWWKGGLVLAGVKIKESPEKKSVQILAAASSFEL
ncbi:uncharacterized protein PHLOEM PROTEIN 2-LIKE A4-like [Diospyros lotus]|uniref:uncharacterized protein PHLOEM PROTEIN 2-LIKE A4-like n=1 Tax=Diospyros lotus TaxID=55363 RepID=UPI002251B203|nr:uncharacterized protein PHLOEM PROTEIN 2-LIKE A4-like [Diospyros lotus]